MTRISTGVPQGGKSRRRTGDRVAVPIQRRRCLTVSELVPDVRNGRTGREQFRRVLVPHVVRRQRPPELLGQRIGQADTTDLALKRVRDGRTMDGASGLRLEHQPLIARWLLAAPDGRFGSASSC